MEEASLASALGLDSEADAETARRLLQLQAGALQGKSLGSQEVGRTAYPDSYYLILDMNGLLLEKRPSSNGRDRLYTLREDIGEFLCPAPLLEECPQHHGHKRNPGVTPGTCGTIGERAQVILV